MRKVGKAKSLQQKIDIDLGNFYSLTTEWLTGLPSSDLLVIKSAKNEGSIVLKSKLLVTEWYFRVSRYAKLLVWKISLNFVEHANINL